MIPLEKIPSKKTSKINFKKVRIITYEIISTQRSTFFSFRNIKVVLRILNGVLKCVVCPVFKNTVRRFKTILFL